MAGQRKRIGRLETIGAVMVENAKVYRELRRGKLEPSIASRLSTILLNQRQLIETEMLEAQIEQMRQQLLLASDRAVPLPQLITSTSNGIKSR